MITYPMSPAAEVKEKKTEIFIRGTSTLLDWCLYLLCLPAFAVAVNLQEGSTTINAPKLTDEVSIILIHEIPLCYCCYIDRKQAHVYTL